MLAIVTVQVDNYCGRGQEYAAKLHATLERRFRAPHRRYCITDAPVENAVPLAPEPGVRGWWQKLGIFKPGSFEESRILFLDLDTLILDDISELADYVGPFATLRDFWRPKGLGPAVMLFRNGWGHDLWEEWVAAGKPQEHPQGDQGWIEERVRSAHILQDMYPRWFVSYKTHCLDGPPAPVGARVICFHGRPRIHEVGGWIREVWEGK